MNESLKFLGILSLALIALIILSLPTTMVQAEQKKITVAADLGHGESNKYLDYIIGNTSDFINWKVINETITPEILADVDVLIIGQPTASFSSDEMQAIYDWLNQGGKVLWIAGDSDYGSGSEVQAIVNDLLDFLGAKLRLEMGAVYDDVHNAQRFYRVLGYANPDNIPELNTAMIAEGVTKPLLFHGPTVVIWVDENGEYHDPVNETFDGLIRIVWNYDTARIADNNPPPLLYYDPTIDTNRTFVMLAAEVYGDSLIVVSGESPYGDYEPTWASSYYGVELDGPRFVTNMLKWFSWFVHTKAQATTTPTTTTPSPTTTSPSPTTTSPTETSPTETSPSETTPTTTPKGIGTTTIALIVIILIIIAVVVFIIRR